MATAYAMHRKVSCSCHGIADEFHKEYILLWDSGDFLDKATELHKIVSSDAAGWICLPLLRTSQSLFLH
jgi:hypothetical protein